MPSFLIVVFRLSITAGVLALTGCSLSRQPPSTRLYVLTALPPSERGAQSVLISGDAVGVGPVTLPQYTDRAQIVTGNTTPELGQASSEYWAEPLEGNFTRVLAENLSLLLATDQVVAFPWQGPMPIAYQVMVEVTRFLGEPGGQVSLEAWWSVMGKDGQAILVRKQSRFTEPVGGHEYRALVAAMSRTVAGLSCDIATTITTIASTPSGRYD